MRAFVAIVACVLAGCRSDPLTGLGPPSHELNVAWHESRAGVHVDAAGVFHYYAADNERSLGSVWRQVRECIEGTAPLRAANDNGRGARRVRIYLVRDYMELNRRYIELYGMDSFKAVDRIASRSGSAYFCQKDGGCSYFLGFFYGDGVFLVRGERRSEQALGHELKHLYEGHFHDGVGKWF